MKLTRALQMLAPLVVGLVMSLTQPARGEEGGSQLRSRGPAVRLTTAPRGSIIPLVRGTDPLRDRLPSRVRRPSATLRQKFDNRLLGALEELVSRKDNAAFFEKWNKGDIKVTGVYVEHMPGASVKFRHDFKDPTTGRLAQQNITVKLTPPELHTVLKGKRADGRAVFRTNLQPAIDALSTDPSQ